MTDGISFFRPVQDEGDVWREESYTAHGGSHVPYELFDSREVSTCTYIDGIHTSSGYYCSHDQLEDFNPGWTVQQLS